MSRADFTQAHCRNHPEAPLEEDCKDGDQVRSECGFVVRTCSNDRVVDLGSEWRTFSNEAAGTESSGVGGAENPLLYGSDLTTLVGGGSGMAAFDKIGNAKYKSGKTVSGGDRVLMNAFKEISQIADRLNLPKTVVDRANNLIKTIHDGKKLRGRSTFANSSACLCMAARQEGVPQTFKEVCAVSQASRREIGRAFTLLPEALDISVEAATSCDFMSRFCSNLGLPNSVRKAATAIAKTAEDLYMVTGRLPMSVAAGAIYMASQASEFKRSRREIGDVAGVGEETIRQVYKRLHSRAVKLFPKDFVFFTPINKLPVP
ncbi:Transcription initiation factor IIB [Orchesella cincta]|uniref:Transcription initiation factor IIB n=1 Tax=Orchesella cincta TaxID=48709 RepID=A0A1D2M7D0_ORCCI|nr:Transcription initiation factor IIB [Orchesella cincta]